MQRLQMEISIALRQSPLSDSTSEVDVDVKVGVEVEANQSPPQRVKDGQGQTIPSNSNPNTLEQELTVRQNVQRVAYWRLLSKIDPQTLTREALEVKRRRSSLILPMGSQAPSLSQGSQLAQSTQMTQAYSSGDGIGDAVNRNPLGASPLTGARVLLQELRGLYSEDNSEDTAVGAGEEGKGGSKGSKKRGKARLLSDEELLEELKALQRQLDRVK